MADASKEHVIRVFVVAGLLGAVAYAVSNPGACGGSGTERSSEASRSSTAREPGTVTMLRGSVCSRLARAAAHHHLECDNWESSGAVTRYHDSCCLGDECLERVTVNKRDLRDCLKRIETTLCKPKTEFSLRADSGPCQDFWSL